MPIFDKINSFLARGKCANSLDESESAAYEIAGLSMFELEQRVLYDASPLTAVVQPDAIEVTELVDPAEFVFEADNADASLAGLHAETFGYSVADELTSIDAQFNSESGFAPADHTARQLIVIDSAVENYEQLISSLDGSTRVLLLDANQSGVDQISQALRTSRHSFDAIHIVSHGTNGGVQLGNQWLDSNSLPAVASELSQWTHWLSSDADVLFYGCNLAETESGEEFIDSIAALTGADVAASDDVTGHANLGGNYDFEYFAGTIEASTVFSLQLQASWYSTLDITSNLAAHYELEESTGSTAEDSTANDNDGTLTNSPTFSTDSAVSAGSYDFSVDAGGNARVEVPDDPSLDISGDFTVAFWYNSNIAQSDATQIIGQHSTGDGFSIYANADGDLQFLVDGTSMVDHGVVNGFISDGNWHHVAATRVGDTFRLYVDGYSATSTTSAIGSVTSTQPLLIGGTASSDFEGKLDDVRVYSRGLDSIDVNELYAGVDMINVSTTNNTVDGTTTSVSALLSDRGADGFISLREAILAVNNDAGTDWTIDVGAGTYTYSTGSGDSSGDFDIRSDVTIRGAGIGTTIIDGRNDRVFEVHSGTVAFEQMTITDGSVGDAGAAINIAASAHVTADHVRFFDNAVSSNHGGAVSNAGTFVVTHSSFDSNQTNSGRGGAIDNSGVLIVSDTTFTGNSTSNNSGGAIYNLASMTISRSTFDGNTASTGTGGAIHTVSGSTATIDSVLFVGNSNTNNQGGAYYAAGTDSFTNTTFSGNMADNFYDGAALYVTSGTTTLTNVTITDNSGGTRGAVRVTASGTLNIQNTIIAGNSMSSADDLSNSGAVNSLGNNLIGNGTGQSALFDGIGGDQVGTSGSPIDPLLGALADNGGPTLTHALLAGSTAIDAGTNSGAPSADQRGYSRDATSDIGAYEFGASNGVPTDIVTTATDGGGINLNNDGGNDAYLVADDGSALLGGKTALSYEVQFSSSDTSDNTMLLSYATSTRSNEVNFFIGSAGDLTLHIGGNNVTSTAMDFRTLRDGDQHNLAFTWSNATGAWEFFVDGSSVDSGTGHRSGYTTGNGGTLLFGQEQDAIEGGFSRFQDFNGILYNARLFSDVRTAAELSGSYRSELAHDEQDMLAQWNFNDLSHDGVITETVNGNNLTVKHTSESGFTASEVSLTFSLNENSLDGTEVGSVAGSDAERDAQIATLLAANPNLSYNSETNKFYEFDGTTRDFDLSLSNAISMSLNGVSGQLVTIGSASENEYVANLLTANSATQVYLGATDATVEGEWRWLDGTNETTRFWNGNSTGYGVDGQFSQWDSGDPNDAGGTEDRASILSTGLWNDNSGAANHASVIEYDADAVLDASQALVYTLQSQSVAGAFAIDSDTGKITVADGSLLNYETNATHTLTVRVTDVDGNTYDEAFVVSLNDLAESNNAPSNLSSGIELNIDGGNDAYLLADDGGAILGGRTNLTVEVTFAAEFREKTILASYASSDTFNNDFIIELKGDNTAKVLIHGVAITASGIDYDVLMDGRQHHLAFSWDNTNGDWAIYVDGEVTDRGTGFATGETIRGTTGTGELLFGQEQDTLGGGFGPNQIFAGTLYDVRVWGEARSDAEVSLNYQSKFDDGNLPSGLIANWQMDGFNGASEVVDVVSGNNLSIGHASGVGFRASTPVDDLHISEHAQSGDSVGYVVPSDPDVSNDVVNDGLFLEETTTGTYSAGQTLGGWTVLSGDVDLNTLSPTPGGGNYVELAGTGPGSIGQDLTTVEGRQYQVVFALSGRFDGGELVKDIRVATDGQSADFSITEPTGWTNANQIWDQRSFTFTALDTSTQLSFASLDAGDFAAEIADIRVIEIPAAIATILNSDPTLSYDAATGKFYQHVASAEDFATAQANALASQLNGVSGQLVTIRSQYENSLVRNMHAGTDIWLGITDRTTETQFYHLDGNVDADVVSYTNWDTSQPDDSTAIDPAGEDYAELASTGRWNDTHAADTNHYVIEWDASEVLSNFTFSLTDASNNFEIDSNTGEITVAATNTLDYETATSHDVDVTVTDAAGNSYLETMTVTVDNLAEANQVVPAAQSIDEDATLTFTSGTVTEVSVTDSLGGTDSPMRVTLSVDNGVLTLFQTTGLTFIDGANGSGSLVVDGTESDINAALNGMTFTPAPNFHGDVTLSMTTALAADLVGSYTFEGGNANDQSVGTSDHGMLVDNATTVIDPDRGEVLDLDGTGDYVDIAGQFGDPANVTLAAWVNLRSLGTFGSDVINVGGELVLSVDATNGVLATYSNGATFVNVTSDQAITGDGWHHIAFSFDDDNNTQQLFIDGILVASEDSSDSIGYVSPGITRIGGDPAGSDYDFNGLIDDARIYTRALSADEIAALAANETETTGSVLITVNPVNDEPTFSNLDGNPTFVEGSPTGVVLDADATFFDIDIDRNEDDYDGIDLILSRDGGANADDVFSATGNLVFQGNDDLDLSGAIIGTVVTNSGGTLNLRFNATATAAQVNEVIQSITYANTSEAPPASVQIDWSMEDGNTGAEQGSGGNQFATGSTTVDITAVNDAPVLDGGASNATLNTITEDNIGGGGHTVSSLIASMGADVVTDPDGPAEAEGIAVFINNESAGIWQYSINGGSTWLDVGVVSSNSALLLRDSDLVRMNPNGANGGIANFGFRAWDQSSGSAGTKADASSAGGTTPFSATTRSALITITSINDAPTISSGATYSFGGINEDSTSTSVLASTILADGTYADVDTGAVSGIAITGTVGNGTWQYSTDGTTWASFGAVSSTNALLITSSTQVRFVGDTINGETANFTYKAWDQTSGSASTNITPAHADTSINGGTTAFSSNSSSAEVVVTSVNDAPTITDSAIINLTGTNEDSHSAGTSVDSILTTAGHDDVDSGASKGIAVTSLTGNGTWQYSTDGTNWTDFGTVSNAAALTLSSSTQVRYSPDTLNGETATFGFVAWDQTAGSASSFGSPSYNDSTNRGGTEAYSTETASASIVVTSINDAVVAIADTGSAVEAGGIANATTGSNASGNVLTNDQEVDAGDTLNVIGVAAGTVASASGNVASSLAGTYGSITLNANGSYTYVVDDSNPIVQALRTSGESINDTFTYTVQDSGAATSSTQIVITITGQNDAPGAVTDNVVAVEAGGSTNTTGGSNPTGNVLTNDADVDSGDTKTVIGVDAGTTGAATGDVASAVAGSYGSITINANGSYTYNVDNSNATVQALRTSSDTITDVFTYTMQDTDGLSSTTQVTVTIQGNNDDPTAVDDNIAASEAGGIANGTAGTNPTGNVLTNDTDIDSGDTKTVTGVAAGSQASTSGSVNTGVTGSYGSITIDATGAYTYTVDNSNAAVQALRTSGQTITEVFTYTMQDTAGGDSTAEVTVTISGANDAPVAVANAATAIEASGINNNISGTDPAGNVLTNDTDVDAGDTKTVVGVATGVQTSTLGSVATTVTGAYGAIVINADGSYTYTLDNDNVAVEALNVGDTLNETFSYTMQDTAGLASTTQIVITIDGRTDQPVAIADQDTSEEAGGDANATPGTNPSGNVLTNDVSNNGKMVIGVAAGQTGSASGSVGVTVTGTYGTVVIDANGDYTYTLDNSNPAVEALLTSGDHVTDYFTYTMEDTFSNQTSTELTITIDGTNDAPIASDDTGTAVEAGGIGNATAGSTGTGNVLTNDTDVDSGDTQTVNGVAAGSVAIPSGSVGASVTGTYGGIVINGDGSYTYTIDENNTTVQALRTTSDTLTEVFSYRMVDTVGADATAELTITIQGSNDAPTATSDTANATESGGASDGTAGVNPTGNVLTNDNDVDAGDSKTVTGVAAGTVGSASGNVASSVTGTYGNITIDASGNYTYIVDNNNATVMALRTSGQTVTDTFTYTMEDTDGLASTTQIVVTIGGANDNIDVVADTATATEASGTANGTAGTNPTGNVLANDTDDDAGDTKNVSGVAAGVVGSANTNVGASVAGLYGSINIASDGSYTYVVDNSNPTVQALLSSSDTLSDVFTYSAEDTAGAVSTTQITITIEGADDAPVAITDTGTAVESGGVANAGAGSDSTGNVLTNDVQVDAGDTWSVTGVASGSVGTASGGVNTSVTGSYGSITIDANGAYTYAIDETNTTVEALRTASDTLTDVFTYTIEDAGGQDSTTQITITIQGQNDNPVAVADNATAVGAGGVANGTAGTDPTGNVLTNDTDVDASDSKNVDGVVAGVAGSASGNVGTDVTGSYGSINIDASGNYTYTVDNTNAAVEALRNSSETLDDVYTYTTIDASGATSTTQITVTIQGANDEPVVSIELGDSATESISETDTTLTSSGTLTVTDVDLTDVVTSTPTNVIASGTTTGLGSNNVALLAMLTSSATVLDATEQSDTLTWNFNSGSEAFDYLADGESLTLTYTLTVTDIAGTTDTQNVVITINGSADAPVITDGPDSVGLTETDAGLTSTGTLTVIDLDRTDNVTAAVNSVVVTGTGSGSVPGTLTNGTLQGYLSVSPTAILDDTETSATLTWNFNSDSEAFDFLATGETLVLTYTVSATDDNGTPLSDTETITVTITGTNDSPVISGGPATSALTETDSGLSDSGTLAVSDLDQSDVVMSAVDFVAATGTGAASLPVSLDSATLQGFLSVSPTTIVDGTQTNATLTWSFDSGTEAFDFLASGETLILTYTVSVSDDAGAPLSDTETVTITITGTNDAPIITGGPDASTLTETDAGLSETGTLTVTDADMTNLVTAAVDVVAVTGTGVSSVPASLNAATLQSYLSVSPIAVVDGTQTSNALNWSFDSGTEAFDFLAAGETLVLTYSVTATDDNGTPAGDTETVTITIVGTNDAPVESAIEGMAVIYTENDPAVQVTNTITISDFDDTDIESAVVRISGNYFNGQDVLAFANTANISGTWDAITGTLTLVGTDALANYESALRSVTYANVSDRPDVADRTVSFTVNDGSVDSSSVSRVINIQPVNDAPVMPVDASVSVNENTAAVGTFAGTDIDGDTLTYSITGADATRFNINSSTGEVTFRDAPNFEAPVDSDGDNQYAFSVIATDNGTGNLTDSQNVTVQVTDVNEAPFVQQQTPVSVGAGLSVVISSNELSFADVEQSPSEIRFLITDEPQHGALLRDGIPLSAGDSFTQADIFADLVSYSHTGVPAIFDVIKYNVLDGEGGEISDQSLRIDIGVSIPGGGTGEGTDPEGTDDDDNDTDNDDNDSGSNENDDNDGAGERPDSGGNNETDTVHPLQSPRLRSVESPEQFAIRTSFQQDLSVKELRSAEILREIDDTELAKRILLGIASERAAGRSIDQFDLVSDSAGSFAKDAFGLWKQLEQFSQKSDVDVDIRMSVGAITVLGTFGGILWALRGGTLMAVAFAQLPGWNFIDPLPILDGYYRRKEEDKNEDLASFF